MQTALPFSLARAHHSPRALHYSHRELLRRREHQHVNLNSAQANLFTAISCYNIDRTLRTP